MDKEKIAEIQLLIQDKLTSFTTAVLHTESRRCVHLEITLSFRKEHELDTAIKALQKTNI